MGSEFSTDFPEWICIDQRQSDCDEVLRRLSDRCRPWVEGILGRKWTPAVEADPYVNRAWTCVGFHGPRFANGEQVSLEHILDRLEQGNLGYERRQSNILKDVSFAEALLQRENHAAEQFDQDYMPCLKRVAHRLVGVQGVEMVDNFLAELILPRESSPPRLASYLGKTSLQSWLKAVVSNFCHGRGRVRNMTQLPEEADPVSPQTNTGEVDSSGCTDLLRPFFSRSVFSIPIEDRLLLKFLVLDEVPQNVVARVLGIHSGNVTRRRQRAAERIWEQLRSETTRSQNAAQIRGCMEMVLTGDNRELRLTLGSALADSMPTESFSDERDPA